MQSSGGSVQKMVTFRSSAGRRAREEAQHDGDENGLLDEQNYVQALGTDNTEGEWGGCHLWIPVPALFAYTVCLYSACCSAVQNNAQLPFSVYFSMYMPVYVVHPAKMNAV